MAKPNCEHGPPAGFEPRLKQRRVDEFLVWHEGPRCPIFMLHKGRQCEAKGESEFPHYYPGYGHTESVAISKTESCLQCRAEARAAREKMRAEKLVASEVRKQTQNGRSNGFREELRARLDPTSRLVESQFIQWTNRDQAASVRDLANLAEDDSALMDLLEGVAASLALFEAGDLEAGQAKLTQAFSDFPGLAFGPPEREPMPEMAGYVSMAQVQEIIGGLWLIAMQHLSPADFNHFRHAIMARTKVPGPTHLSTIIQ